MKYQAQMQRFADWIASSPTKINEIRLKKLIDDFSFRLYDGKANPISIKDLQTVRRTLELTLMPVVQGRKKVRTLDERHLLTKESRL